MCKITNEIFKYALETVIVLPKIQRVGMLAKKNLLGKNCRFATGFDLEVKLTYNIAQKNSFCDILLPSSYIVSHCFNLLHLNPRFFQQFQPKATSAITTFEVSGN